MKIGIVDTMFARVNMGAIAIEELKTHYPEVEISRITVPGIKDLAVECKRQLDAGCEICLALGMVGGATVDMQCAHESSIGIQNAKLLTNKHIIEAFVHENEAWNDKELLGICTNRIRKHTHNAVLLVKKPLEVVQYAGRGIRQGKEDEGPIGLERSIILAIVVSKFNNEITERMQERAVEIARAENITVRTIEVPGVFDMPLIVKKLLMEKEIDAVITLGAVVKGETAHDEVVTKETARRLGELSLEFRKPVTLGIIGHEADWDIAEERAESYAEHATKAAIQLVKLLRED